MTDVLGDRLPSPAPASSLVHFQKFMSKNLLDDSKTHSIDIKED